MEALPSTSEIVELVEQDPEIRMHKKAGKNIVSRSGGNKRAIDNEINQLLETINFRTSTVGSSPCPSHDVSGESLRKSAMKRPIRVSSAQASGIGITEPVNMKQALRGFCISQASEMAAMKRLPRPTASPGASDARTIKRLYKTVVAEAEESGIPHTEVSRNVVEVSLVPEKLSDCSAKMSGDSTGFTSTPFADAAEQTKMKTKTQAKCQNGPISTKQQEEISMVEDRELKSRALPLRSNDQNTESGRDTSSNAVITVPANSTMPDEGLKGKYHLDASQSGLSTGFRMNKSPIMSTFVMKPVFKNKSFNKKKAKQDSSPVSSSSAPCTGKTGDGSVHSTNNVDSLVQKCGLWDVTKGNESTSPDLSSNKISIEVNSTAVDMHLGNASCGSRNKFVEPGKKSSSRGKWEFSQSSKSSIGEYSCSTSISEESYSSGSNRSGNRHHMSKDHLKKAIQSVQMQYGTLCLTHFKMVRRLGCGDIGTVYLAELTGTNCLFALKLMDIEFLVRRNKLHRAQTEREILQMLDHPFLPTLYAHFSTDKLSCLVMEYCPGGDLHVLRQKQPSSGFSEQAARFYAAEVLLALEYLHMLGVVYRDLKPENILVREDGHIMLTDFDLSLRCVATPVLVKSSSPAAEPAKEVSSSCTEANCINPSCLDPSWQVSCFNSRLTKSRKMKCDLAAQISPLPELIVEPTSARSNSFVGTYEYLAPEIIKGEGHGSAVDWWTFGIFLFELLYGKTPFKGSGNEETLANVVSQSLRFPSTPIVSFYARDLIRGLLIKEPDNRLGSAKGATEIKQHPFFEGLNWPLIRCARPPELPNLLGISILATSQKNESIKCEEFKSIDEDTEFEMF